MFVIYVFYIKLIPIVFQTPEVSCSRSSCKLPRSIKHPPLVDKQMSSMSKEFFSPVTQAIEVKYCALQEYIIKMKMQGASRAGRRNQDNKGTGTESWDGEGQ